VTFGAAGAAAGAAVVGAVGAVVGAVGALVGAAGAVVVAAALGVTFRYLMTVLVMAGVGAADRCTAVAEWSGVDGG
jgi:hypothetical protein